MDNKSFYAVVLKSGQFVTRKSLEELAHISSGLIECVLFARYDNTFHGPSNITDWYQFSFINDAGDPIPYRIGNFEIVYVDKDDGCTNFFGRRVSIHDVLRDKYYEYTSKVWYDRFVIEEIKPLLERLNKCEENEIPKILKTHPSYAQLEWKIKNLEASISSLEKENEVIRNNNTELLSVLDEIKSLLSKIKSSESTQ